MEKELKIGEEVRIRCVESPGRKCKGCVFDKYGADCDMVKCECFDREDGKDVRFELVEE